MKTLRLFSFVLVMLVTGCSSSPKSASLAPNKNPDMDVQLKVTGANSRLVAKLTVKNLTKSELTVDELNSRYFVVQTTDGKTVSPKSSAGKAAAPLKIKPGATGETVFTLQDNYPFWDRLTKYRISYSGPTAKTEPVSVWF